MRSYIVSIILQYKMYIETNTEQLYKCEVLLILVQVHNDSTIPIMQIRSYHL